MSDNEKITPDQLRAMPADDITIDILQRAGLDTSRYVHTSYPYRYRVQDAEGCDIWSEETMLEGYWLTAGDACEILQILNSRDEVQTNYLNNPWRDKRLWRYSLRPRFSFYPLRDILRLKIRPSDGRPSGRLHTEGTKRAMSRGLEKSWDRRLGRTEEPDKEPDGVAV